MHSTIKLPNFSSQFARGSLEETKLNWRNEEEKSEEKKEIIREKQNDEHFRVRSCCSISQAHTLNQGGK